MSRRPVRVVFCLDSLGVGGTEMNAVRIAERLDRSMFKLSVACFRGDGALRPRFEAAGVQIDVFPVRSLYGSSMIAQGWRFMRFLHRDRVDVVHAHDRYANVFAGAWARLAGTRAVITSKRWGSISTAHGVGNRIAYRLSDRVLANSAVVGASLASVDDVPARRIVVIPNFVDEAAFDLPEPSWLAQMRIALALPAEALVVGIVANLRAIKNHRMLLDAVSLLQPRFPNLVLVVMGEGPERAALEARTAELNLGQIVRFVGMQGNLPNPHRLFDISVLCSLSEGFPNSIVEAMAAARSVVATNVGGVPDSVEHGVNGLLIDSNDVPGLVSALERLLNSSVLRAQMGHAGQQIARSRFTATAVIPMISDLYRLLAGVGRT